MALLLMIYSFGWHAAFSCLRTTMWRNFVFYWAVLLTLVLMVSGLYLIISCHVRNGCYKKDERMTAGILQCVGSIFSGYLSFLYNPRVIIVYT